MLRVAFPVRDTRFLILFVSLSRLVSVFKEAQSRQHCEAEGSHQGKRSSLFHLRVHEGKPLPTH